MEFKDILEKKIKEVKESKQPKQKSKKEQIKENIKKKLKENSLPLNNEMNIEIKPEDGNFWFKVTNKNGGTQKQPYGTVTRESLQELKTYLDELLK